MLTHHYNFAGKVGVDNMVPKTLLQTRCYAPTVALLARFEGLLLHPEVPAHFEQKRGLVTPGEAPTSSARLQRRTLDTLATVDGGQIAPNISLAARPFAEMPQPKK